MLILGGAGVLAVAICLHIAWVAKRAVARGRNAWAWVGLALVPRAQVLDVERSST